jgi:hypothetical protein
VTTVTPPQLTDQVLDAFGSAPDPQLRGLLGALIADLHAFAVRTRLSGDR